MSFTCVCSQSSLSQPHTRRKPSSKMSEDSSSSVCKFDRASKLEINYLLNPARSTAKRQPTDSRHKEEAPTSSRTRAWSGSETRTGSSEVTTGESPSHETHTGGSSRPREGRVRRGVRTNLQQKRASMAQKADRESFRWRGCCKRMKCFERVDEDALRNAVRETLLMRQTERRERLKSWLRDGVFVFDGGRVCSAFLAEAFGFSRDLQRGVKREVEKLAV